MTWGLCEEGTWRKGDLGIGDLGTWGLDEEEAW